MAEPLKEFDELDPASHFLHKEVISRGDHPLMIQFSELDRTVSRITVTEGVLTQVKVDHA